MVKYNDFCSVLPSLFSHSRSMDEFEVTLPPLCPFIASLPIAAPSCLPQQLLLSRDVTEVAAEGADRSGWYRRYRRRSSSQSWSSAREA